VRGEPGGGGGGGGGARGRHALPEVERALLVLLPLFGLLRAEHNIGVHVRPEPETAAAHVGPDRCPPPAALDPGEGLLHFLERVAAAAAAEAGHLGEGVLLVRKLGCVG